MCRCVGVGVGRIGVGIILLRGIPLERGSRRQRWREGGGLLAAEVGAVGEIVHGETESEFLGVSAGRERAEAEEEAEFLSREAGVGRGDSVLVGTLARTNWSGGGVGGYLELMAVHR